MDLATLYVLLKETVSQLAEKDPYFKPLPEKMDGNIPLNEVGLDIVTLPEVAEELKSRLGGRNIGLERVLNPQDVNAMNVGQLLGIIHESLSPKRREPLTVYVDDEEENIFIFKRRFGKSLNLKTFTDPEAALAFIKSDDSVALVITDEVMPRLSGNDLCDEVHKVKPFMRFVLITGNPNNDGDLMYKALRKNRFYDFINKPVDFDKKGEEYLLMFQSLISFEW
jgi:CheY-like chemotaxis protein